MTHPQTKCLVYNVVNAKSSITPSKTSLLTLSPCSFNSFSPYPPQPLINEPRFVQKATTPAQRSQFSVFIENSAAIRAPLRK